MKTVLFPFLFLGLILLFACNDDGSVKEGAPDEPASEQPVINKFVSIGDSLTAGVQSNGLVRDSQENSFPFFIAQQLGIDDFEQPLNFLYL